MGFSPLTKEERKKCWKARDDYIECLDKAEKSGSDSKAQESRCDQFKKMFFTECPSSWADYFLEQRATAAKKKALEEKLLNPKFS